MKDRSEHVMHTRSPGSEELNATISCIAGAVLIYGEDGTIKFLNAAARDLFGLSEENCATPIEERLVLAEAEDLDGRRVEIGDFPSWRALKGQTVRHAVLSVCRRFDGKRIWLSVSAAPIRSASGRSFGAVSISTDITEMLELQRKLVKSRGEMELQVRRRTEALSKVNKVLKAEIRERKGTQEKLKSYHEQLQFLASELSLSEERERRRIASVVHDHVGQNLAVAKIRLESLRQTAEPALASQLKSIQEFIEQAIQDTRFIITELSPPVLYELGLVPAMQWVAENIQVQHGISTVFESDGKTVPPIEKDIQVLLFRVVRELLWNVVKHARASHVRIFFRTEANRIQIGVEDNGLGFDASALNACTLKQSGGFGIFSIRERLRPLGGHLRLESAPGMGTRAMIEMELTPPLEQNPGVLLKQAPELLERERI